jgi:hypothetical protein
MLEEVLLDVGREPAVVPVLDRLRGRGGGEGDDGRGKWGVGGARRRRRQEAAAAGGAIATEGIPIIRLGYY